MVAADLSLPAVVHHPNRDSRLVGFGLLVTSRIMASTRAEGGSMSDKWKRRSWKAAGKLRIVLACIEVRDLDML